MFNIARFSSHINRTGTLPVNKFYITFRPPRAVPFSFNTSELIYFRAEQIKVPGFVLNTIENRPYSVGVEKKYVTGVRFTDSSITFLDDGNNSIYKLFNLWSNAQIDYSGTTGFGNNNAPTYRVAYKQDITTDIQIAICDNSGNLVSTVVLREAMPTYADDTSLGWDNNNNVFKVIVGFTFSDWYIENLLFPTPFTPPTISNFLQLDNFVEPNATSFIGSAFSATAPVVSSAAQSVSNFGTSLYNGFKTIAN